jgi:uncharacterized repeat protein (TIGR03803 family)
MKSPSAAFSLIALPMIALALLSATTPACAQTFTLLDSFDGTNGSYPESALTQGLNGFLYGTTWGGGANGDGTVFKITPGGTLTVAHSFAYSDGQSPSAGLILATNGNFYGTTYVGGAIGYGTVFKVTANGALTTLHSFDGTDGGYPDGNVAQATNGNFYGTTQAGGANNFGTVFEVTPSGTLTSLYSFCSVSGCEDGQNPYAGLIQATNGNLYGTTLYANTYGTIFQSTPAGVVTTIVYFDYFNGAGPDDQLFQGTDGFLYGTTGGGGNNGYGTVFKTSTDGTLTTIYNFSSTDGAYPYTGLIEGSDGKFYGTTNQGGSSTSCVGGCGTIFNVTSSGTLTTLHSFDGADGSYPQSTLVQDTNGTFYGTARYGGANNEGTVFSLSMGLAPFVETLPTAGKVGSAVKILGTNLTGASAVTFNGIAATFTVASSSEITTTVPAGATTGSVSVTTTKGKLKSNRKFIVKP